MTVLLIPNGQQVFLDNNGIPLAGGKVYFYIPTTTTLKTTWQDIDLSITNTNPVVLDAAGRATIWGDGQYRQIVRDVNGNLIWDKITSTPAGGALQECGPVLYAGVSYAHDEVPDPDHQECQFKFCNMNLVGESEPQHNTMITFIAGLSNAGTAPTGFQIFFLHLNGDPYGGLGYSVFKNTAAGPTELDVGDVIADNAYFLMWNEVIGAFILTNPTV